MLLKFYLFDSCNSLLMVTQQTTKRVQYLRLYWGPFFEISATLCCRCILGVCK
jgi:hypothetical protein